MLASSSTVKTGLPFDSKLDLSCIGYPKCSDFVQRRLVRSLLTNFYPSVTKLTNRLSFLVAQTFPGVFEITQDTFWFLP